MGVSRPLPRNTSRLQKARPQAIEVRGQVQSVYEASYFVEIQTRDIFCPAVHDYLADVPLALEWIGKIDFVGAPDDIPGRRYNSHNSAILPCPFAE